MLEKTPIQYFIYIRKSSDENTRRQVLSLNAQLFELRKYAEANKLPVFGVVQESKTAKQPGRKEFNAMLDQIERGMDFPIGILSWHPDRLSRNKVDETRLSVLLDNGKLADLKFPTHAFINNASGKFFLSIQMANAKYYIDQLSENITRGQREKLRAGAWPGSVKPFGYIYDTARRNIAPKTRHAKLVVELFRRFATGDYSIPAITKWFNNRLKESGIAQKRSRNGIEHLLRNPLLIGIMRWGDQIYEGKYQKIIKPALFNRVQRLLHDPRRTVPRRARHEFLYRGIFKCSCGAPITAQFGHGRGGTYRYYRCTRSHGPCHEPYMREEEVHTQTVAIVERLRLPQHELDALNQMIRDECSRLKVTYNEQIQILTSRIEAVNNQLQQLVDLHLSGGLDSTTFQSKHEQFVTDRLALKSAKMEVETRFPELWFEHAQAVVAPLNKAVDIDTGSEIGEVSTLLKKVCSNPTISKKRVAVRLLPPYEFVASQSRGMQTRHQRPASTVSMAPTRYTLLRTIMDAVRTAVERDLPGMSPKPRNGLPALRADD